MFEEYRDKLPDDKYYHDMLTKMKQIPYLFHPDITFGEMKDLMRCYCENYVDFQKNLGEVVLNPDFTADYIFRCLKMITTDVKKVVNDVSTDDGVPSK